jgi:hypothetical protein
MQSKKKLNHYFGEEEKSHFTSNINQKKRPLVRVIVKVFDRLRKRASKLSFMKAKKE